MRSLAKTIVTDGVGAGLVYSALMFGWDAWEGRVPAWPRAAWKVLSLWMLFAIGYGTLVWLLRRRSRSPTRS